MQTGLRDMSSWSASHTRLVLCRPESIVFFSVNGLEYRRMFNLTHLLGGQCDVYLTQIRLHFPSARKFSQKCSDAVGLRVW